MDIVFLGTGDATPGLGNGSTSFVVRSRSRSVLVEATGPCLHDLLRAGLDPLDLDGLIVTHFHPDHVYALPSLLQSFLLLGRRKPFSIQANEPTLEKILELCRLFDLPLHPDGYPLAWSRESAWNGGDLRIELFPVEHSIPTSGVKLSEGAASIVYSSDTRPCRAVVEAARGARLLVHEATGLAAREKGLNAAGHSSARQAGQVAREAGVERLLLCHIGSAAGGAPEDFLAEAARSFGGDAGLPALLRMERIAGS